MTLRLRLLLAMSALLLLVAIGGLVVIRSQESLLIDQVDEQLASAVPFTTRPIREPPTQPPPGAPADEAVGSQPDTPISRLFVGVVADGVLTQLLRGELLDDTPEVPLDPDELARLTNEPATVDGSDGTTRFRIVSESPGGSDEYVVVALPLDEVDSSISRLELTVGLTTALAAALIAVTFWWVERLGLRPIRQLTTTADAITAGDRDQRAPRVDSTTEAGRLARAVNIMLDERDANEDRRRRFVADASHELRTPLTSIRGYLDLYSDGRFATVDEVDDMVRRMTRESARMQDLVDDLLLLANLDEHRPLRHDSVDLVRLLDDAAADARAVQPDRPVTVELPEHPIVVTGDVFRLQQAIGVLLTNALTHTERDVAVRLTVNASATGAHLTVADDGPGLDRHDAERVFDRFYRSDPSRSRRSGSSGLGLAIAQSIVEAHDGSIAIETAPGRGCAFTITLPIDRSADASR